MASKARCNTRARGRGRAVASKAPPNAWGIFRATRKVFPDFYLRGKAVVIGRARSCQVSVKDGKISGRHCQISRKKIQADGQSKWQFLLKDISTNGTFAKAPGTTVPTPLVPKQPTELADGTEVFLVTKNGSHEAVSFVFEILSGHRKFEDFYEKGASLGRGAFADVYRATNQMTGAKYAVKVVHKKQFQLMGTERPHAMMDEVHILKAVNHENIIKIQDVFDTKTDLMIVLELVEKGELFDHIVENPFTEAKAKDVFRQLLLAIRYLHSRGIAHRDLKPENILVSEVHENDRLTVKISDFGMARLLGDGSFMKTLAGTPQYLAPEILTQSGCKGRGYHTEVDMWSLGVILYILLSARAPFKGDTGDGKLFENVQRANYSFGKSFDKVSAGAKDLIRKLLVVNPNKRYSAAAALMHPWLKSGRGDTPRRNPRRKSTSKRKASPFENLHTQETILLEKKRGKADVDDVDDLL